MMTAASVSQTWELHIFRHVCGCSHAQLRHSHPNPHISDLIHLSTFFDSSLFAHTHENKHTLKQLQITCKHTRARRGAHTYPFRHIHTHTHHMQQKHTTETSSPLPPNWIVCSDNPQDSRSIDVRGRPMKIQGPWGGLRELCTSSQLGSQAFQPPMSVFLFLFTLICRKMQ